MPLTQPGLQIPVWCDDRDQPLHPIPSHPGGRTHLPLARCSRSGRTSSSLGTETECKENIQRANRECSAPSPAPHHSSELTELWCSRGGLDTEIQPFMHSVQAVSSTQQGSTRTLVTTTVQLCTAREQTEPATPCQAGGSAASECGRVDFPSRPVPPLLRSFASGSTFPDSTTTVTLGKLIHEGHSSLQPKHPSPAQEYTCPTNKVSLRKLQVSIYEQHPLLPALQDYTHSKGSHSSHEVRRILEPSP